MTRGGILAGGVAAAALIAAGALLLTSGMPAKAQSKKEAQLELKGDASIMP